MMSLPSHDYSATKHITNNNKTTLIQQINTNNIKDLGIKKTCTWAQWVTYKGAMLHLNKKEIKNLKQFVGKYNVFNIYKNV